MKIMTYIVYGVSQVLYKLFGVNTPSRKAWLADESCRLQEQLDYEHNIKKVINKRENQVYTTKKVMQIARHNNLI